MSTPPPADRTALARERLAARARRASNLRRRVVAGALASFALAWGVIAFHGPMGEPASPATASTQATATGSTPADDDTAPSGDAAPVTTAQS